MGLGFLISFKRVSLSEIRKKAFVLADEYGLWFNKKIKIYIDIWIFGRVVCKKCNFCLYNLIKLFIIKINKIFVKLLVNLKRNAQSFNNIRTQGFKKPYSLTSKIVFLEKSDMYIASDRSSLMKSISKDFPSKTFASIELKLKKHF